MKSTTWDQSIWFVSKCHVFLIKSAQSKVFLFLLVMFKYENFKCKMEALKIIWPSVVHGHCTQFTFNFTPCFSFCNRQVTKYPTQYKGHEVVSWTWQLTQHTLSRQLPHLHQMQSENFSAEVLPLLLPAWEKGQYFDPMMSEVHM